MQGRVNSTTSSMMGRDSAWMEMDQMHQNFHHHQDWFGSHTRSGAKAVEQAAMMVVVVVGVGAVTDETIKGSFGAGQVPR